MITTKSNNKFTIVSVVKWEDYQDEAVEKEQQNNNKVTTKEQQNNTNKNVKNVNNVKNKTTTVGDSCVDGLQKIIDFYNENIGLITPYGLEILEDYAKEMTEDLIILSMKKAVEADKRTIQYIKGILNNWSKKGIKTVLEAKKEDEKFKKDNKKQEKSKPEQREYAPGELSKLYANLGGNNVN